MTEITELSSKVYEEAIEKWYRIAFFKGEDKGIKNCSFCKLFASIKCIGCPVSNLTGKPLCNNTPYSVWIDFTGQEMIKQGIPLSKPTIVRGKKSYKAALDELEFLIHLCPDDERKKYWTEKMENRKLFIAYEVI